MRDNSIEIDVTVVMPCLNEEETIGTCVKKAMDKLAGLTVNGEVLVVDNGSTDRSVQIANELGARVVHQPIKGYGSAYLKGLDEARGKYIVMGDSDDSYDFLDVDRFIEPLQNGYDMVMGSRLKGKIMPGAMPWHHRYFGNPVLTWVLNFFFGVGVSDAHCGMRSITKEAYERLYLQTTGMEFASEMIINASKAGLRIKEIPITLYRHGRSGSPHLRSFRDGWRHLRLMLFYAPTHLFFYPGIALMVLGFVPLLALFRGPIQLGNRLYDLHLMVLGSLLVILGLQVVFLGLFARAYCYTEKFPEVDNFIRRFYEKFTLERGIYLGLSIALIGFAVMMYLLLQYFKLSEPYYFHEVRAALLGMTLIVIGVQTVFSSFLLSIMHIKTREET